MRRFSVQPNASNKVNSEMIGNNNNNNNNKNNNNNNNNNDNDNNKISPTFVELECLREINPKESLKGIVSLRGSKSNLDKRIEIFEDWIDSKVQFLQVFVDF